MGNRGSVTAGLLRRRSEAQHGINDFDEPKAKTRDFGKSQSMMELGKGPKKQSEKKPGAVGQSASVRSSNGSSRNGSATVNRQKSVIRRDIAHPISPSGREIIQQCFDNPHSEFGNKVNQRIFEKRQDYQKFIYALGKERWSSITTRLKDLVEDVISRIDDVEYIAKISRSYGEEHVEMKTYGFKPDFWVSIADAITVEGVILDMANHQPADTVAAWSQLVSLMFSSVRDGYYSALRAQRMNSRRSVRRQPTVDSTSTCTDIDGHEKLSLKTSSQSLGTTPPRSISMYTVGGGSSIHSEHHLPKPIFE